MAHRFRSFSVGIVVLAAGQAMAGPGGDTCSTAIPAAVPSTVTGDTSFFNPDFGVPSCGASSQSGSVWYAVTGTGGTIRASLCLDTAFDTVLAVYTGACGGLSCVAANDDACDFQSEVEFSTAAGQTYYVVVRGFGLEDGPYTLGLTSAAGPCNLDIPPGAQEEFEEECGPQLVGCNGQPVQFQPIMCNIPLHGNAGFDAATGIRDTDWFVVTLGGQGPVTLTLSSEFACLAGFLGDASGPRPLGPDFCSHASQVNPFMLAADDCQPQQVSIDLPPGEYVVFVGATFSSLACDDPRNDYLLLVTSEWCAIGDGDCNLNGIQDHQEIMGNPALDCFNPAVIQSPHGIGGPDGALDVCQCQGNWNRDGAVNSSDISAFLVSWINGLEGPADFDCSGLVNSADISAFLTTWIANLTGSRPYDGCP